jgi:uncharacterized protein (TIGR03435 family)
MMLTLLLRTGRIAIAQQMGVPCLQAPVRDDQLELKLESRREAVGVIVIDSVERPTPN